MKYIVDHDLHIHSVVSACCKDPEQNNQKILEYAVREKLKTICLTNHFWDDAIEGSSEWYAPQNYEHLKTAKPLPKHNGIRFLFGCETELNHHLTLGISKEKFDLFDLIVIPTTHFHMVGFTLSQEEAENNETRAKAWVRRLSAVLEMDLPFHKVGLAHLTSVHLAKPQEERLKVLDLISDKEMEDLFGRAAKLGVGIELNVADLNYSDDEAECVLRPYKVAKKCGCKFYCGSDSHRPSVFEVARARFERTVDLLGLTEDDKFTI